MIIQFFCEHDEKALNNFSLGGDLENVWQGILYLKSHGFPVKLNAVIASYNLDDIEPLVSYAVRLGIDIKFLDLFNIEKSPQEFRPASIAEIKNKIMGLYGVGNFDFECEITYYECESCEGCPHKKSCTKAKKAKAANLQKIY